MFLKGASFETCKKAAERKRVKMLNQKVYFYIGQSMSWSSAQNYCREHYLDLAMIENQEENTRAGSAAPSSLLTWIGLYREPWTWSDQSHSTFRNNNPAGLTNPGGGHCVLENTDGHLWDNQDCSVKNRFICRTRALPGGMDKN
uniref:C-type lectin domain-containing protein n=1 Tax=Oryzias sinensis TaxID=183150 RepID=A0A8C7XZF0_9TELE